MASPIVVEDEEYLGKARIYHRFRISGWPQNDRNLNLRAVQKVLQIIPPEQARELADQLIERRDDELDELRQYRLRTLAAQEAGELMSSLTFANSTRYAGFDEYVARHEDPSRQVVRLFSTDIRNPKQVYKFRAFRIQDSSAPIFLFNSPGPLVDAFLKRLAADNPKVDIRYPQLDLKQLEGEGRAQIRGASFSISNRPNLRTAMVFGPDVNTDDAWEEYSSIGELTYIQLQLRFGDDDIGLMVTRRGSLMPYGVDDINEELRLCKEVYDQYLKQFETGEAQLSKRNRKR